jgi:hypothetical protein
MLPYNKLKTLVLSRDYGDYVAVKTMYEKPYKFLYLFVSIASFNFASQE